MDVYYMSDSVTYSSFRSPSYRDYEKFPYGSLENVITSKKNYYSTDEGKKIKSLAKSKTSKAACPFCKEHKKRPLVAYMKKRQNYKRNDSIMEEEEEEEEEEEDEVENRVAADDESDEVEEEEVHNHSHHDKSHSHCKK